MKHPVRVEVRRVDGEVLQVQELHNDVVQNGRKMFPVLAASGGAYTYAVNKLLCGSSSKPVAISDSGLTAPWSMTAISAGASVDDGTWIKTKFGIPPNVYTGLVLQELGFYFDAVSGSGPLSVPGLYSRAVLSSPIVMAADIGVYIEHWKGWTN